MKNIIKFSILVLILGLISVPLQAQLHEYYKQYGDCYLLIGNGPFRGIYALNNLTGGTVQLMYNRADLDSYGLVAAQKYISGTNTVLKYLYTFAGEDTGIVPVSGMVARKVVMNASNNIYDWSTVPPFTVHRFHGSPFNSPTGRGNHPQGTLNYKFGGFDYPCSEIPSPVATMAGYYWVQAGRFYHAADWPVWSPYVYQCGNPLSLSRRADGSYTNACATRMGGPDSETREYAKCGCGPRSARGGWVHWALRENIEAKFRDLKLYEYDRTNRVGPSIKMTLPRVKTFERSTMDKRGECIDGCIQQADGITLPGNLPPYLDTAYSSALSRSYLYSREPNVTNYTLTGLAGSDQIVGIPTDLTAKALGVSSKDESGNYVYVLGINEVNKWLTAANAPPDMRLASLTDVAVSDQWWQTGGLVYAYDRTKGKVYKFVRKEDTGGASMPEELRVDDISLPDSIGVDGFGHLFMVKTNYTPVDVTTWTPTDSYNYYRLPTTLGPPKYRAQFRQKVSKAIFKRDYYTGVTTLVPGEVPLGNNEFIRDFGATDPTDYSTWIWIDPAFNQVAPVVNSEYRTELAVINSATPPETGGKNAICDNRGPLIQDPPDTGPLVRATPDSGGFFRDDTFYYFEVENAPIFDANGVNVGSTNEDRNGNGRIGGFPATTEEPSLKYFWKIKRTKDRYGSDSVEMILDQEGDGTFSTSSLLPVNLPGGEYDIMVKTKFKYFDYDRMLPGELASKKYNYLSAETVASGTESGEYSKIVFKVKTVPDPVSPGGRGVVMSGKRNLDMTYSYRPKSPADNATSYCDPNIENPPWPSFVIKENAIAWSFQLRESNFNLAQRKDRIASITSDTPPNPGDPRMETGTLNWEGDVRFTWSSSLDRAGEGIVTQNVVTSTNTIFIEDIRTLFPVPSQPATYTMKVEAVRAYSYYTYLGRTRIVGGRVVTDWTRTKMPKVLSIKAECAVYVTDETPPLLTYKNPYPGNNPEGFFYSCDLMYGTTGETLANTESPKKANPDYIEFVVADNNPFGNINGTNFTDPFHTSEFTHHNLGDQLASFTYKNSTGNIPLAADSAMQDYYLATGTGAVEAYSLSEAQFKAIPWIADAVGKYNKSLSYRHYRIQRDKLVHFSKDRSNNWVGNMALEYANSDPGFKNLTFGLGYRESSGLGTAPSMLGQIIIRDNDRPNCFIKMVEQKHPTYVYYSPANVNPNYFSGGTWLLLATGLTTESLHNGIYGWNNSNISGFDSMFKITVGKNIQNIFASPTSLLEAADLETDIPVLFSPILSENVGSTTVVTFGVRNADGTSVAGISDSFPLGTPLRCLFRKAGDYRVILKVKDSALDWPIDEATAKTNATNAALLPNDRELDTLLKVSATRLDVRVIDRTIQGR